MKKKILIIGGSSKVGRTLINNLDKKIYSIHSTYFKNKLLSKDYSKIKQFKLDLNKENNISIKKSDMNYDVIILLSGVLLGKSLSEYKTNEIKTNIDTNFTSQAILLKEILKFQKKKCLIVFFSSIAGRKGSYDPIYAAAKGALISFSKSLSLWISPKVNCITLCPGIIKDTKMYKSFTLKRLSNLKKQTPNKEFLNPKDLSKIICDIIQPHWRHANGTIIDINGGIF